MNAYDYKTLRALPAIANAKRVRIYLNGDSLTCFEGQPKWVESFVYILNETGTQTWCPVESIAAIELSGTYEIKGTS